MVVQNQSELGEGSANPTDPHHTPTIIQSSTQPQKTQKPRKPKRKDTQVPQPSDPSENVADEAVQKELGDSLVWLGAALLLLVRSQSRTVVWSPKCQEDIHGGYYCSILWFVSVSKHSNDSLLEEERINAIDADDDITLVSVQDDADKEMFNVDALNGEEVFVVGQNENVVEEALEALKTSKPKVKGTVFQEQGKSTTTTTISSQKSQVKGKGIMIEKPVKPIKKKDQISFDEEVALKLQAKIDVYYQLAERLQAQEQEEFSIEEKTTLFQQLLEKRRKHFAAKRA
ncbi:hypothetical protein Tco_0913327 [Tanacetum coccineum]